MASVKLAPLSASWAYRLAYGGYALLLFALASYFVHTRLWIEDHWVHAAIVRELLARPFSPSHPLLAIDHEWIPYWPYAVFVAGISRVTGLAPYAALATAGMLNLALLLTAVPAFVRRFSRHPAAPFYAVAFLLLLWGPRPWLISGFIHAEVLFYVLSFPSTCAIGLTLLALAVYSDHLGEPTRARILAVAVITSTVMLIHSLTAIFLFVGICALLVGTSGTLGARRILEATAVLLFAAGLAVVWPYFPLLEIMRSSGHAADRDAVVMYVMVWERVWPACLGIPVLCWRLRRNALDPLFLMFLGMVLVYVYGRYSGQWSYGRVLPYAAMIAQIALACSVAAIATSEFDRDRRAATGRLVAALLAVVSIYGLTIRDFAVTYTSYGPWDNAYYVTRANKNEPVAAYSPLAHYVGPRETVFADPQTSLILPAFTGRIVFLPRPSFFGDDWERRRADVDRFFNGATTPNERRKILDTYGARYVLLDTTRQSLGPANLASLEALGAVRYRGPGLTLVDRHEFEPQ
jgi:hypothetical protein